MKLEKLVSLFSEGPSKRLSVKGVCLFVLFDFSPVDSEKSLFILIKIIRQKVTYFETAVSNQSDDRARIIPEITLKNLVIYCSG